MRVYHLSESSHALSNIALRRIKISRFSDLNDPFELLGADLRNKDHRRVFRETKEELHRSKGLLCFSRSWENPVLWSHYADKHRGICLGFDVPDHLLAPVIYTDKPMKIARDEKSNRPQLTEEFMNGLLRTKFIDWKYEDELRLFVQLDHKTAESGLYFFSFSRDFSLQEVILGPRCDLPIKNIRELVAGYDTEVYVVKARVAFTKFKVVENRVASRTKTSGHNPVELK
jgi:hypothetical protein